MNLWGEIVVIGKSKEQLAELGAVKAAKRAAALAYQRENTFVEQGVTIMPAIGKTGGKDNVGWEMHKKGQPAWYVSNTGEALRKVPKFIAYGLS